MRNSQDIYLFHRCYNLNQKHNFFPLISTLGPLLLCYGNVQQMHSPFDELLRCRNNTFTYKLFMTSREISEHSNLSVQQYMNRHGNGPVGLWRLPHLTHVHPWSNQCAVFLLSHSQSSLGG